MSASPAQIAANRANAQHSTGPRTPEGKAASARNALSHGAYASDETILAAPDSPAATYLADFTAELAPRGSLEAALVRQLALCTARMDLLNQSLDAFPQLNQRRALVDCLQEQYDVLGPSAHLKDQPQWSAALRRYDGCPATYPRDPDPSTDPDLAACTLVYSLSSPRYGKLLRRHAQAGHGFSATLRDLQHLQAARRRAGPAFPPSTAHLEAISDLLDRGYQLLPPDHPLALSQNEPNPAPSPAPTNRAHTIFENEPDSAAMDPLAGIAGVAVGCQNEPDSALHPSGAGLAAVNNDENEPDPTPTPPGTSPAAATAGSENEADSASILSSMDPASGIDERENEPISASDLAILDRLTRHAEAAILETERRAASSRPPAMGRSVEDEIAGLRALAQQVSARHAPAQVPHRGRP